MMISIDDLVPQDHLVRKMDKVIDFNFIYDLVEDKYCLDNCPHKGLNSERVES